MSFIGNAIGDVVGDITGTNKQAAAAQNAAQTEANSANYAAQLQNQQFQTIQQNLSPYMQLGTNNIPGLQSQLGQLGNMQFNFNPTEQQLQQTPGYQFTLNQGLNTVNNQLASKGLNLSGAQAKGIAGYTTGLADQTYQQQYQNALQNFMTNYGVQSDQYNRLAGLVGTGQNAAANLGSFGTQITSNVGNLLTQAGSAQAAGITAQGNSQTAAFQSLLNGLGNGASIYGSVSNANSLANLASAAGG
jgi:hypothetical protein